MAFYSVVPNGQGGNNVMIRLESFSNLMMVPGERLTSPQTISGMMPQINIVTPQFAGQTPLVAF